MKKTTPVRPTPIEASIQAAPVLQAQAICFGHVQQQPLFTHWSTDVPAGLTLIQGGDGAGKTSLLRLLAGEWAPQQGRLLLQGIDAADRPDQYRAQVFWRDPRSPWPDDLTARDWADGQRALHAHWSQHDWRDHVAGWGLAGHLHKPLQQLSTGSQRKVLMAAALASGAPLTLLDEPLAGLDKASVAYLLQALQRQAHSPLTPGRAVVVAHHDALGEVPWRHIIVLGGSG